MRHGVVKKAILLTVMFIVPSICFADALCGNGIIEAGEDCDDGGTCIGGSNAGTHCTKESDCIGNGMCVGGTKAWTACTDDSACPGGLCQHCIPQGGDGCAVNCTVEQDIQINSIPGIVQGLGIKAGTSGQVVHSEILTIPMPLTGFETLTVGQNRNGEIPVVIKTASAHFPRIPISASACACLRIVTSKTCGGTWYDPDGITPSTDCTDGYTAGETVCPVDKPCTFLNGAGNAASGVVDCGGTFPANVSWMQDAGGETGVPSPPIVMLSGTGGIGSALLLSSSAVGSIQGSCSGTDRTKYGPDSQICTDDDPQSTRGNAESFLVTTGTTIASIMNANQTNGDDLGGPLSITGMPFSCTDLVNGDAAGAALVYASTSLNQPVTGDIIVSGAFVVESSFVVPTPTPTSPPSECVGDCSRDTMVTIDELITMINVALGNVFGGVCPGIEQWCNSGLGVTVDCIVVAVLNALDDCGISGIGGPCGGNLESRMCAPGLVCQLAGVPDAPGTCVFGPTPTPTISPTATPTRNTNVPCSTDCNQSCSCAIGCPPPVPIGSWVQVTCPDGGCICEFLPI